MQDWQRSSNHMLPSYNISLARAGCVLRHMRKGMEWYSTVILSGSFSEALFAWNILESYFWDFLRFSRETGLVSDCVWTPMKPARQSSHMLSHWFWVFISPQDPLWRTSALRVKSWPAQSERFGFNNATTFYDCEFPVNSTLQHVATAPNNDHLVSAPGCLWVSAATMRVQIGAGSGVVNLCPIVLYYVVYVVLCMINIDLWDYVL